MKRYRVLLPLVVHTEDGSYGQGEEFEKEFSSEEERANLESGLLEVVPQPFEITGPHAVSGHAPGSTVEMSLSSAQEFTLTEAGHIRRVEVKPAPKKRKADRGA